MSDNWFTFLDPPDMRCTRHEEVKWNAGGLESDDCWVCGEPGEEIPLKERPVHVRF